MPAKRKTGPRLKCVADPMYLLGLPVLRKGKQVFNGIVQLVGCGCSRVCNLNLVGCVHLHIDEAIALACANRMGKKIEQAKRE